MKIIILLLKTQDIGGAENVFLTILRNLKQSHFAKFVFCLESPQGEISKKAGKQGIKLFINLKSLYAFISATQSKNLNQQASEIFLISNGLRMLFLASLLKIRFKNLKIIFPVFWDSKKFNFLNIIFLFAFIPISFFCNLVVSNSSLSQHDLSRKFFWIKNRIELMDNGIDIDNIDSKNLQYEKLDNQNFSIISVSRLQKRKGFEKLLSVSIPLVLKKYPQSTFNIIGKDFLNGKLQDICIEKNIVDNVNFLGFVDDVEIFYQQADLFILPSLFEGVPTVLLEAMSWKLPALAFNAGGISEIYKYSNSLSSELLINNGDYVEFAHAIIRILDSKVLRSALGKDCQKNVIENFSSLEMSKKFMEFIENA